MDRREFIHLTMLGAVGASAATLGCSQPAPPSSPPPAQQPAAKAASQPVAAAAQRPDLELNFEGLLAFARPSSAGTPWSVLFVKTEDLTHPIERHWPLLRIRTSSLDPSTAQPPPPPAGAPSAPAGFWQWDLSGAEVSILRDNSVMSDGLDLDNASRPRKPDGSFVACSATSTEHGDVSWLPDLKQACGSGKLTAALLTGVPGSVPRLGARLRLSGGRMKCAHTPSNVNAIWTIANGYVQNMADKVTVSVPARGAALTIRLQRGGQTTDIALKSTEQTVEARFRNMVGGSPAAANPRSPIEHFSAYYELLATLPPPAARPIPQYKSECDGTVVSGGGRGAPAPLDPPAYCPSVTGDAP